MIEFTNIEIILDHSKLVGIELSTEKPKKYRVFSPEPGTKLIVGKFIFRKCLEKNCKHHKLE
jgi:hypothetical protein